MVSLQPTLLCRKKCLKFETCQHLRIFLNYPAKIPILWRIMKRQVTLDIFLLRFFAAITMRCHLKWALKASIIKSFTSCLGVKSPSPLNSYPHRHHFFLMLDMSQEREKKRLMEVLLFESFLRVNTHCELSHKSH